MPDTAQLGAPVSFRQLVEREAYGTIPGQQFETRGPDNAAVVTEYLFHTASKVMRILTSNLVKEVYGKTGIRDAALAFLKRDSEALIFVLSETPFEPPPNPFAQALKREHVERRVHFKVLTTQPPFPHPFNFAVADECSFRFEPSRDGHRVLVGFRQMDEARRLCQTFDRMWSSAKERSVM